jgi:hypothetical protein
MGNTHRSPRQLSSQQEFHTKRHRHQTGREDTGQRSDENRAWTPSVTLRDIDTEGFLRRRTWDVLFTLSEQIPGSKCGDGAIVTSETAHDQLPGFDRHYICTDGGSDDESSISRSAVSQGPRSQSMRAPVTEDQSTVLLTILTRIRAGGGGAIPPAMRWPLLSPGWPAQ